MTPSSKPNENQLESLLQQCAQRLGTTPQAHLVPSQGTEAQALQKVLTDPQAAQKLLATPQAQKLLRLLGNPPQPGK